MANCLLGNGMSGRRPKGWSWKRTTGKGEPGSSRRGRPVACGFAENLQRAIATSSAIACSRLATFPVQIDERDGGKGPLGIPTGHADAAQVCGISTEPSKAAADPNDRGLVASRTCRSGYSSCAVPGIGSSKIDMTDVGEWCHPYTLSEIGVNTI
jgi:hypothetical protein